MEAGASIQYIVPKSLQLYFLTQAIEMIGGAMEYNDAGHVGIPTSDPFNASASLVGSVYGVEPNGICSAYGLEFFQ